MITEHSSCSVRYAIDSHSRGLQSNCIQPVSYKTRWFLSEGWDKLFWWMDLSVNHCIVLGNKKLEDRSLQNQVLWSSNDAVISVTMNWNKSILILSVRWLLSLEKSWQRHFVQFFSFGIIYHGWLNCKEADIPQSTFTFNFQSQYWCHNVSSTQWVQLMTQFDKKMALLKWYEGQF